MPKCIVCNKHLVAIGNARTNGKNHNDWNTRKLHKKCFPAFTQEWTRKLRPYFNSDEETSKAVKSGLNTFESIDEWKEWVEDLEYGLTL